MILWLLRNFLSVKFLDFAGRCFCPFGSIEFGFYFVYLYYN